MERISEINIVKGKLVHPKFNNFCRWFNGSPDVTKEGGYNAFAVQTSGAPLKIAKILWPLYVVLQAVGLVNKTADKLAKAWYGAIWSVVYSAYRPFKDERDELTDESAPETIPAWGKSLYKGAVG